MTDNQITIALEDITVDAERVQKLLKAFRFFVGRECPMKGETKHFMESAAIFADHMDDFIEVLTEAYKLTADISTQSAMLLSHIRADH